MDVDYRGAAIFASGGKDVLGIVRETDVAEKGFELSERLNEQDVGVLERLIQLFRFGSDPDVNDRARVEAQGRDLVQCSAHACARDWLGRSSELLSADLQSEGVEEPLSGDFCGIQHSSDTVDDVALHALKE